MATGWVHQRNATPSEMAWVYSKAKAAMRWWSRRYRICTDSAPRRRAARAASMAVLPAPMTTTAAYGEVGPGFVSFDKVQGVDDGGMVFAGNAEFVHGAQAYAEEDGVVVLLEFGQGCGGDFLAKAEVHAQRADHFDFTQAVGGAEFILGDAVGVEAAGESLALKNGNAETLLAKFRGAGERSGAGANAGDLAWFVGRGDRKSTRLNS